MELHEALRGAGFRTAEEKVADVLGNYRKYRSPNSSGQGDDQAGIKVLGGLDNTQLLDLSRRVFSRDYSDTKAVGSMFKMALDAQTFLQRNWNWKELYAVARVLLSAGCYAKIYKLTRDKPETELREDDRRPYYIVRCDEDLNLPPPIPTIRTGSPFPRWESLSDKEGNRLYRASDPSPPELYFKPRVIRDSDRHGQLWLVAVHRLEATAFRINERMLNLVVELDEGYFDDGKYKSDVSDEKAKYRIIKTVYANEKKERDELAERSAKLDIPRLRKLYNDPDEKDRRKKDKNKKTRSEGYLLARDEEKTFQKWRGDNKDLRQKIASVKSSRARFEKCVTKAKELVGEKFFHRARVDFRGRIYLLGEISYQGSDFERAVIEFDKGAALGDSDIQWVLKHIDNLRSVSSGGFDDVVEQYLPDPASTQEYDEQEKRDSLPGRFPVLNHYAQLWRRVENKIPSTLENLKKDTGSPYGYLRACMEISDYYSALEAFLNEDTNDLEVVSHLPVEMDQSNSAYQHIGCLVDDEKLRRWSNLEGDEHHDLYQEIADRLNNKELGKASRTIVKEVAKKWAYDASLKTCCKELWDLRNEDPDKYDYLQGLEWSGVWKLTQEIIATLEKECEGVRTFINEVKTIVRQAAKEYKALPKAQRHTPDSKEYDDSVGAIRYHSPMGFQMVKREHGQKKYQRTVWGGEEVGDVEPIVYQPTDVIWGGAPSMESAAPPNLVHSLDATLVHAVLSVGRFWKETFPDGTITMVAGAEDGSDIVTYPVVTIHDAFACHACNCEDLNQKFRDNMKALYRDFDPLEAFRAGNTTEARFQPQPIQITPKKDALA